MEIFVSRQLFRHLKHKYLSTGDDSIYSSRIICLVLFFTTREAVVPLANYSNMLDRLIWSIRHLGHQNTSIISDFLDSSLLLWSAKGPYGLLKPFCLFLEPLVPS